VIGNPLLLGDEGGYNLTRSLRFRASATGYLSRTAGTSTSAQKGTVSLWVKRGTLSTTNTQYLFQSSYNAPPYRDNHIGFTSANTLEVYFAYQTSIGGGWTDQIYLNTTQVFRDPAAWYHIVVNWDTTQATASDRASVYVNGQKVTSFGSATYPTLNQNLVVDTSGYTDFIGYSNGGGVFLQVTNFDGYMAEYNRIDGQALTPSSFGASSPYNQWLPKKYSGTYGTNGFYLPFTNNASAATLGNDFSGNSNTWTTNNISVTAGSTYDSMTDVPTLTSVTAANYCVLNALDKTTGTLSNGNLTWYNAASSQACVRSTMAIPTTGKWYWEATCTNPVGANSSGIALSTFGMASFIGDTNSWGYHGNGYKYVSGVGTAAWGATYTTGDVIAYDFDASTGALRAYKNNTLQGTLVTGLSAADYFAAYSSYGGGQWDANFGQRPFSYTPPTGYLALNTFNL